MKMNGNGYGSPEFGMSTNGHGEAIVPNGGRPNFDPLAEAYNIYSPRIFGMMLSRTGDRDQAEDLTSQTFLKALEAVNDGRPLPSDNPEGWLFRIGLNTFNDYCRSQRLRGSVDIDELDKRPAPEDQDMNPEAISDRQLVEAGLRLLSEREQEYIELRYGQGLKPWEIFPITGDSHGAAKQLQHRALSRLREAIKFFRRTNWLNGQVNPNQIDFECLPVTKNGCVDWRMLDTIDPELAKTLMERFPEAFNKHSPAGSIRKKLQKAAEI